METKTYKLKDIAISIFDGVHNSVLDNENGDCFLLSAKNIKNGIISFDQTDRKIDKSTRDKLSKRTNLAKDDVLVTTVGTVGELAIVDENYQKYEFQRSVGIIKCNQEIVLPQYLYYLLKTESYNYYLHVVATGVAQPCIFLSTLKNIKVKLPNLHVQSDVVSVLSKYDKLINNYQKQIEDLQNLAGELYKEWFVRFRFPGHEKASFENGIPAGWKVDKIKNRVKRLSFGKTYKKDEVLTDGEIIVIDQSESEYLGYHNGEPSHKATIDEPIALFGDHSCKYELMTRDFSLGENVIPFVSQNIDVYYLYYAVYKIVETEEYKRHWSLFINKKILIPEEKLQLMFRKYALSIKKQTEILSFQITNLSKQRALLLPRLMSGKLEVK